MSKVITFSRFFPTHHPRKGQPTDFVEKIWKSLGGVFADQKSIYPSISIEYPYDDKTYYQMRDIVDQAAKVYDRPDIIPKRHTIRAGNRWKAGDKFSPRVWSGKPYQSKQIIIASDIEIKKVWRFDIFNQRLMIDFLPHCLITETEKVEAFALNDGLSAQDMLDWFKYPNKIYEHQIICWDGSVNY